MTTPMTVLGERQLREELERLKNVSRRELSKAIGEAIKLGDLRENSDYHTAKDRQGFVEARIREIEAKLADAQVIDITRITPAGRVVFGATVALSNAEDGARVAYRIVGEDEANLEKGTISVLAPLARAMIGREVGDDVRVPTPTGSKLYTIESIEHV